MFINNNIKFYAICIYYVIAMNKRPMGHIAQLSNKQGMAKWFRRNDEMFYLCELSSVLPHYYLKKYDFSDSSVILYTRYISILSYKGPFWLHNRFPVVWSKCDIVHALLSLNLKTRSYFYWLLTPTGKLQYILSKSRLDSITKLYSIT